MKLLVSAMACNPVTGSEAHFGWAGVRALSRHHEVHVLLFDFNRPYLSEADRASLPNVTWHFLGRFQGHHPNRLLARLHAWLDSVTFQRRLVLPYAQALHGREKFDRVHHLTIASWRVPSPLWQLGIPLIWGPIGGGEDVPRAFFSILSSTARWVERLRALHSIITRWQPALRQCARRSTCVLASNPETQAVLQSLRGQKPVGLLSSAFFTADRLQDWQQLRIGKDYGGQLRLFAGGSLEGRKGIALALTALAQAKNQGLVFQFRICGGGPEANHLQKLSDYLGFSREEVVLEDFLTGDAYREALHQTHIFLMPSLRENAGLTLMEAMLAGCVPIVAQSGGPGLIVPNEVGFPLPVDDPDSMVASISRVLLLMDQDRPALSALGAKASEHIQTKFSEDAYLSHLEEAFRQE